MKKLYPILKIFLFILFILNINTALFAAGDSCSNADTISVPGSEDDRMRQDGYYGYYYYEFTPDTTGTVTLTTSGMDVDTDAELYNSDCSITLATDYDYANNINITYNVTGGTTYKIVLFNYNNYRDRFTFTIDFTSVVVPPTMSAITDQNIQVDTTFSLNISDYTTGNSITYTASGLPPGLSINSSSGIISGTPTTAGTYTVTVSATNSAGSASQTFDIIVSLPVLAALDDSYTTSLNTTLTVVAPGVLSNDTGAAITITAANLNGLRGNIDSYNASTGAFTFTPESGYTGSTTFTYTITDSSGSTATATVTINIVVDTDYDTNLGFELINPPSTRNIVGGYAIAGNTVLCLTGLTTGYASSESQCLDTTSPGTRTSNNYVAKFIDIDGDSSTWNASSSNITLPDSYEQQGGNGILWAGLIWQGRFAWDPDTEDLRYYTENGSTPIEHETGKGTGVNSVSLTEANVKNIRLKIDSGSYNIVTASKVYSLTSSDGITYSAIADATSLLRSANLAKGKHTFTVANLPTEEGREHSPGVYGGWTLVVIYAEDPLVGKPRNISIYGGMDKLLGQTNSDNLPIEISGFKLPSSGSSVSAQLSIFSGEGELPYTPDGVQISDNASSGYVNMPTSSSATNIFDAVMNDIDRDEINDHKNNLQNNNVGVDVDNFDLSAIVSGYNRNITSLYLKWYSGTGTSSSDYIIPGMIAFSTELYQPNICYDYTLDIEGYVIPSIDNLVQTPYGSYGNKKLTTRVSIKSLEGDFALEDVNVTYRIGNTNHLQYITDSTAIAPNGIYSYIPAGTTGLNQTYNQTNEGFGMYIGEGASPVPGPGGIIDSYETRYFKFIDDMKQSTIDTRFDLALKYTVDYGSGPLELTKIFDKNSTCLGDGGYYPAPGIFNTTSTYADKNTGKDYNLYTQISRRDFDVRVFSYNPTDTTYTTLQESNATIEVEVFNAGFFARDVNLSCFNPDSNISFPQFISFDHDGGPKKWVDVENLNYDFAIRNAGFRTWHLTDPNTKLIYHDCSSRTDETCFHDLYTAYYEGKEDVDRNCTEPCTTGTGCYACLRSLYGKPICSRDNFSIRPEAFVTLASDSNRSTVASDAKLNFAHSRDSSALGLGNTANIIAGYNYRFDVNATSNTGDSAVRGYIQSFNSNSINSRSTMKWTPGTHDVTNCNDVEDDNISIVIFHGSNIYSNTAQLGNVDQIGIYTFDIGDANWTAVDWYPGLMTHHTTGFNANTDCLDNDGSVDNDTKSGDGIYRQGCDINSTHNNTVAGLQYTSLNLEFFPYTFNVSGLSASSPIADTLGNEFVYINTLDDTLYPKKSASSARGIDENMSYNIQGIFSARGWSEVPGNGTLVSNFVNKCYAYNVDMNLTYIYLSSIPTDTPNMRRDIIDQNTTDPSVITRPRENNISDNAQTQNAIATFLMNSKPMYQKAEHFAKDMKGALNMDLGLNFDRTNDNPLNPRRINFQDFNISYQSNPNVYVDGVQDHKIYGNLHIDKDVTFLYAKTKPGKFFYDDVTDASIITPISVVTYCEFREKICQDLGLQSDGISNQQTNETSWWKAISHTSAVGNVVFTLGTPTEGSGTPTISSNIANFLANGEDNTITVGRGASPTLPMNVPINLIVNDPLNPPAPANYTDRWLIYNIGSPTLPPVPFYKVRFIGDSTWSGVGKTGNVVGNGAGSKKTKRLDW